MSDTFHETKNTTLDTINTNRITANKTATTCGILIFVFKKTTTGRNKIANNNDNKRGSNICWDKYINTTIIAIVINVNEILA